MTTREQKTIYVMTSSTTSDDCSFSTNPTPCTQYSRTLKNDPETTLYYPNFSIQLSKTTYQRPFFPMARLSQRHQHTSSSASKVRIQNTKAWLNKTAPPQPKLDKAISWHDITVFEPIEHLTLVRPRMTTRYRPSLVEEFSCRSACLHASTLVSKTTLGGQEYTDSSPITSSTRRLTPSFNRSSDYDPNFPNIAHSKTDRLCGTFGVHAGDVKIHTLVGTTYCNFEG
ncbi:hypothetical protein G7Y79_00009g026460 [Physcia stellaris]|nr:hypothetical protein G7Y79_00009g026460 [Physcia stellaris]